MPVPTKISDLPNFKELEAMALEIGRMLSESRELCETLAAAHQRRQRRTSGEREGDSLPVMRVRLAMSPFYLSRKHTDI